MRRVRVFNSNEDSQILHYGLKTTFIKQSKDLQILTNTKLVSNIPFVQNLWAKFATDNFEGIDCLYTLEKSDKILSTSDITFTIYSVDSSQSWQKTPLSSKLGTRLVDGTMVCRFTPSEIGSLIDVDGELTFAISIYTSRLKRNFNKLIYVNHLGVYDSIIRLKNKINYLEISKLDE